MYAQQSPEKIMHDNINSLNDLVSNLAGKGTSFKKSQSNTFTKCRYCDTFTTNIYHHLKIDKHYFACTELDCKFVSTTVQECKNHLFYHYCKKIYIT
jgi:hypothetical protein